MVENQRQFFLTGKTADLEFRKGQLRVLKKVIENNKEALSEAVHKDLKRNVKSVYPIELSEVVIEIDYALQNLDVCLSLMLLIKSLTSEMGGNYNR